MKFEFCPNPPSRLPDCIVENTVSAVWIPELVHPSSIKHVIAEIATVDISRFTIHVYSTELWGVIVKMVDFEFRAVSRDATSPKANTVGGANFEGEGLKFNGLWLSLSFPALSMFPNLKLPL